jgi:cytoskeletal protein CcmA (bactofilin family)
MRIFSKQAEEFGDAKLGTAQGEGSLSIIAAGLTITGDLETDGVVKIEGKVEGSIRAGRQVLIGRQGEVRGDITTREAVIGGTVFGVVTASERVEVQGTSMITGDLHTKAIVVLEGGKINGMVRIADAAPTVTRQYGHTPPAVAVVR